MTKKTLRRDISILEKILKYQNDLIPKLNRHGIFNISDVMKNPDAKDLVAFSIVQIYELSSKLTDETLDDLSFLKTKDLRRTRNIIVHNYGTVTTSMFLNSINCLSSSINKTTVVSRILYCRQTELNKLKYGG